MSTQGLSARQIGDKLGASKGAVLGLQYRAKPAVTKAAKQKADTVRTEKQLARDAEREARQQERQAELEARRKARQQPPWEALPGTEPRPLHALRLTGDCCWPLWKDDDAPKVYCGAETGAPSKTPYCRTHMRMAYYPARTRKELKKHG